MSKKLFLIASLFASLVITACGGGNKTPDGGDEGPKYYSVSEAIEIANQVGEEGTPERQYVTGVVDRVTNSTYGEMYITDGTKEIHIYGLYSSDGTVSYADMSEKPYKGDTVYVLATISIFKGAPDLGKAWLVKFDAKPKEAEDLSDYVEVDISIAREAEEGEKVIVEGIVGYVTYASGNNPNGIYLLDDKASIYAYGVELAGRVKVGNKVKIAGTKTNYILDSEKGYAEKFGYNGSCQLQETIFIESDEQIHDLPLSWVQESTVKDILDTSVSENITTSIYKVHAYIREVPGVGFTNFYIYDLDDKTGSYCYSLNNGHDFDYLKEYDGKICLVYLSPLNCKATNSSAYFRFIPVKVEAEDFVFDKSYAAEFAIKYYVKDQFLSSYNSDPSLVLPAKFSHEGFGISDVVITYSSSDEKTLWFVNDGDNVVMHVYGSGDVNVTVKATYMTYEYQIVVPINVDADIGPIEALTVKQAIETEDGNEVTVKGIVASGTVNQAGFYLIDETGVIAVRMDATELKELKLGNEVIVKGTRKHVKKDGSSNMGQSCIDGATTVVNLFGEHDYSKASFVTTKSFEDILTLKGTYAIEDWSTTVFVAKAYLVKVEGTHSTNYYLCPTDEYDKNNCFYLYAGSGSQYSSFDIFLHEEVTIEFILCDWNSKSEYRACLISVSDKTQSLVNNYNFKG